MVDFLRLHLFENLVSAPTKIYFAAELYTYPIRIGPADMPARLLKAAVFRQLGYATVNANWRGLYLTAANVLRNAILDSLRIGYPCRCYRSQARG